MHFQALQHYNLETKTETTGRQKNSNSSQNFVLDGMA
jgi:hypothetical protein